MVVDGGNALKSYKVNDEVYFLDSVEMWKEARSVKVDGEYVLARRTASGGGISLKVLVAVRGCSRTTNVTVRDGLKKDRRNRDLKLGYSFS